MRFPLHLHGIAKPAFALVSVHGLTDLDSRAWVVPYAAMALLPVPTEAVTALFCVASVWHFKDDAGLAASMGTHLAVLVIGLVYGMQAAFTAMLYYLALVHVPAHYTRCVFRGRGHAAWRVLATGVVAAGLTMVVDGDLEVPFTDEVQRLIMAHVWVESEK